MPSTPSKLASKLSLFALLLLYCISLSPATIIAQTGEVDSVSDIASIERFRERLKRPVFENLLMSSTWTLTHDYKDLDVSKKVLTDGLAILEAVQAFTKENQSKVKAVGGYAGIKTQLVKWLDSDEHAVRAFAVLLIGISGDKSFAPRLAELVTKDSMDDTPHVRWNAALAIGLIEASEFAPTLIELLSGNTDEDKIGAMLGLVYLKAKHARKDIERLKNDSSSRVREAAAKALQELEPK